MKSSPTTQAKHNPDATKPVTHSLRSSLEELAGTESRDGITQKGRRNVMAEFDHFGQRLDYGLEWLVKRGNALT